MRRCNLAFLVTVIAFVGVNSDAIAQQIHTVAGGGPKGNLPALSVQLYSPYSVAVDASGNSYVIVQDLNEVARISPAGVITIIAGNGGAGYNGDNGPATSAELNYPAGVAVDAVGNVYIADTGNYRIRAVNTQSESIMIAGVQIEPGDIATVAGTGTCCFTGDNGPATSADLSATAVAIDAVGNIYIGGGYRIREVTASGQISTIVGTGSDGNSGNGGPAMSAEIGSVGGIALDTSGNLYFSQTYSYETEEVTGEYCEYYGYYSFGGGSYCEEYGYYYEYYYYNYENVEAVNLGSAAATIAGVTIPAGDIATIAGSNIANDYGYNGDGIPATSAYLSGPEGIAVDGNGNIFIADAGNERIRLVNASGTIYTIAGNGVYGYSGDGSSSTTAELDYPAGVAVDAAGNLYIADTDNGRIRVVDRQSQAITAAGVQVGRGDIATIAGGGVGDGYPAASAELFYPEGVAVDGSGNIYIADSENDRIRVVNTQSTAITIAGVQIQPGDIATVAGTGTYGYSGDNGAATSAELDFPYGVAVDGSGNIYIADSDNDRIRVVNTQSTAITIAGVQIQPGDIATVAGTGTYGYSGDNGAATSAELDYPEGVAVDGSGNLYIPDTDNQRIRVVNTQSTAITIAGVQIQPGDIATVAGTGTGGYSGDNGAAPSAELYYPEGVAVDGSGNLYIPDTDNQRIRVVNTQSTAITIAGVQIQPGDIATVAGTGTYGYSGDNGAATSAELYYPEGVAVDGSGNLYIPDTDNQRIRKVSSSGTITTIGGDGNYGYNGDQIPATTAWLGDPRGIALDSSANIYFADEDTFRVRRIDSTLVATATQFAVSAPSQVSSGSLFNFTVTAEDANGNVVTTYSGAAVFTSSDAAASLPATAAVSNGTGTFQATFHTDGSQAITATDEVNSWITGTSSTITVSSPPTANSQFAATVEGTPTAITLTGSDQQNESLTFVIDSVPSHGTLSELTALGAASASTTYTPNAQFVGNDSFTFHVVNTSGLSSPEATVTISVSEPIVSVTIGTNPTGLNFSINGTPYSTTQTPSLTVGNSYTLATTSPQTGMPGVQYVFSQWSDGTTSLTDTLTPTASTTGDVADFTAQYLLTVTAGSGGTLAATTSPNGFYNAGTVQALAATPNAGYYFTGWTGANSPSDIASATSASTTVTMNGPENLIANFAPNPSYQVTTLNDDATGNAGNCSPPSSSCTLRDAITAAEANNGGAGTITFASGLNGTITLTSALPALNGQITITGPGAGMLTVSGNNAYEIFEIELSITPTVSISGLTLANGNTSSSNGGGAIFLHGGTLTITNCAFSNNSAPSAGTADGGAIAGSANTSLTVASSTFDANSAGAGGGAIASLGSLTVTNSTFSGNFALAAGAIVETNGTAMLVNNTFSGNSATVDPGGAVYASGSATVYTYNNIFAGNRAGSAGAGIYSQPYSTANGSNNVYYNNLTGGSESDCYSCKTGSPSSDGNILATANPLTLPLGYYGGPTQTIIPPPGSAAICAGSAALIPVGVTTDQRGFPNTNTSYPGYSAGMSCVDAGAVQTNYALNFTAQQPSNVNTGAAMSPAPIVTLTESGTAFTAGSSTVAVTDADSDLNTTASTTSVATSGGQADFSTLIFTGATSSDALTASLALNPNNGLNLSTISTSFGVGAATPTVSFTGAPVTAGFGSIFTVSATTNSGSTATITASGACTITGVTVTMTSGTGVCSLTANWAASTDYLSASAMQSTNATQITPTVTFTGAPSIAVDQSSFVVAATTTASTAPVITASGPCSVAGTTVTMTGSTGACILTATWAADSNYLAASATQSTNAAANTCTVTDNSDNSSDTGSLRYCVNNAISGQTINFSSSLNGQTITLSSANGPLGIGTNLTIQGPGANLLTISGGKTVQVFADPYAALSISGLTIANGYASGGANGGAINTYQGTVSVTNSTLSANSGAFGGAIYSAYGTVTVTNSTFAGNSVYAGGNGGAITVYQGSLIVNNSTFFGNSAAYGGGIYNVYGPAVVSNSTLSGNSASNDGGAIDNYQGTVTVFNSIVAGNTAPGQPGNECRNCGTQSPYNLISTPSNIINPMLAPPGRYGGSTQTMIPLFGSPALGAGLASSVDQPNTDQRSFTRPTTGTIDLGAVQTNYLVVTTTNDASDASPACDSKGDGPCSFRDAMTVANTAANTAGADITFAPGVTGTINLSIVNSPLPVITGDLDLVGPGAKLLTISGGNSESLANLGSIFTVNSGAGATGPDVAFTGITISNGYCGCGYNGGAIFNGGTSTMTVSNSAVSGNTVVGYGSGAGIFNVGTLSIVSSTISGNNANSEAAGGNGGGIINGGTLTMISSTVSGNFAFYIGGGIFNNGGMLTMIDSTVSGNTAGVNGGAGGGILNNAGGMVTANNTIVAGNTENTPGDDCDACGMQSLYNLISTPSNVITPMMSSLGNYGGPTQTMLPLPGSAAICAGSSSLIAPGVTTDQRGYPNSDTSYSGYSAGSPCVDAGAVQTNYQSVQFNSTGYSSVFNQVVSPSPVVSVTESGQNIGGVPVTLSFSGTGAVTGLGPVTTAAGTGATFSSLSVNTAGSDTLSATLPIVGLFSLNASAALTVNPVTPTVSWPAPSPITYGTALSAAQLDATASVAGGFSYSPAGGTVLGGGSQILSATFTPTNSTDYTTATASVTLLVNKAMPTVTFTGAPASAPYEGTFVVAATTNASTIAVIIASGSCSITGATVTITAPSGTCSLTATWAADNNYLAASAAQSTTTTQATPVITWAAPPAITYGTALSGTQLNATATYNGTAVAGALVYTPAKGTVLTAGMQTLSATFTPTKTADFTSARASVSLQVNQATPKITWTKPAAITYGTVLSSTQLDATASVAGTLAYSPAAGTILTAGSQTLSVTFTPTDAVDYTTATDSVTITVNQAAPTVTWGTPAAITYGTELSGTQLDATASVPGTFIYSPAAGAIENGGSDKLSVTFTPTDSVDYTKVTASVTLQVNQAMPTINWGTPAAITYGTALSGTQLDATATYNGATVAGTFVYTPAKGTVLTAGTQTLSVTFTPTNTTNYATPPSASVTIQVKQATPTITWAKPAAITYGTALSSTQLDATASVPGTFGYSPAGGTVLGGGAQTLSVTFTPADTTDYTTATDSVTITINTTTSTTTITSNTPDPATVGEVVTVDFSITGANGVPTGGVTVTASTGESCSGTLGITATGSCTLTFTATGSPKLTAAYGGDSNFKSSTSAKVTETVN